MQWLKRSTSFLLAFLACAVCASAQSASSAAGVAGSSATSAGAINSAATATNSDAWIGTPGLPADRFSSSARSDPYSPFDSTNSDVNSLRKMMMYDDFPPERNVVAIDLIDQEDCGTWTQVGVHSAAVSTVRLEVPGKARGVYQRACSEMKKKKMDDAERDAERAVAEFRDYPAAWVLLGQVYYKTSDMKDARQACSTASKIDPDYVSSYLCLAAIADHQQEWDQAQKLSDHALQINPLRNAFALYYKAEAAFHKSDLPVAERAALDAAGVDTQHQLPEIELLLACIYSGMKKSDEATVRARNYLKFAHQPDGPAAVSAQLTEISKREETSQVAAPSE